MKKNTSKILIILAIIMLFEGIGFLAAGIVLDILWLIVLGGVFLGLYVFSAEFYILKVIGQARKEAHEKGEFKETENELVQDVNSTKGLENYLRIRAHQFDNISHFWKTANAAERIWFILFTALVSGGFISIFVCLRLGYMLVCAIIFGAQVLIICGTLVVARCRAGRSITAMNIDTSVPPKTGKVISCCLYLQTTLGKGEMSRFEYEKKYHPETRMTTRIIERIYKLKIDLQGKRVIAFSEQPYNAGEEVAVCQSVKYKRAYIITELHDSR